MSGFGGMERGQIEMFPVRRGIPKPCPHVLPVPAVLAPASSRMERLRLRCYLYQRDSSSTVLPLYPLSLVPDGPSRICGWMRESSASPKAPMYFRLDRSDSNTERCTALRIYGIGDTLQPTCRVARQRGRLYNRLYAFGEGHI